jgi:dienelactone hydrolase
MSESVKQNFRDIASRLSETEGMRVIVDNLYSNYVTTQQKPDVPDQKKNPRRADKTF